MDGPDDSTLPFPLNAKTADPPQSPNPPKAPHTLDATTFTEIITHLTNTLETVKRSTDSASQTPSSDHTLDLLKVPAFIHMGKLRWGMKHFNALDTLKGEKKVQCGEVAVIVREALQELWAELQAGTLVVVLAHEGGGEDMGMEKEENKEWAVEMVREALERVEAEVEMCRV